jgi:lipopolysaccharide transport system ATP-binding protein
MIEYRDQGRTAIVFVSHNLAAVELMCARAVWLDRGTVRAVGPSADVIRAYLDNVDDEAGERDGESHLVAECVEVLDCRGRPTEVVRPDEPFTVRVRGQAQRDLIEPVFVVTIRGDHGPLFAGNMHIDGNWPARVPSGSFEVECAFGPSGLAAGRYRVELKVKQNVRTNYYEPRVKATFVVPGAVSNGGADVPAQWRVHCPASQPDAIIGGD